MFKPYADILAGELHYCGNTAEFMQDPVAIGAVGGSGTRVIADLVERGGIIMATPMNRSRDAMEWPPLDRILAPGLLARFSREQLLSNAFNGLERLLLLRQMRLDRRGRGGWKVPGTHLWLDELCDYFPRLQYVHLIRNGLDMAYSPNRQQARRWAHRINLELDVAPEEEPPPPAVLEYWLTANERAISIGRKRLGDRFLLLRFEDLLGDPKKEITRLMDFIGARPAGEQLDEMAGTVHRPRTVDRYRRQPWREHFSTGQLRRLEALGYHPQETLPS